MFVVLSGKVSLDLGVNSVLGRTCGPGALVGLPSTLTRLNYSMTATVTEDAELGFWSPDPLDSLLLQRRDLCQPLLAILGAKIAENHEVERALLTRDRQPVRVGLWQYSEVAVRLAAGLAGEARHLIRSADFVTPESGPMNCARTIAPIS